MLEVGEIPKAFPHYLLFWLINPLEGLWPHGQLQNGIDGAKLLQFCVDSLTYFSITIIIIDQDNFSVVKDLSQLAENDFSLREAKASTKNKSLKKKPTEKWCLLDCFHCISYLPFLFNTNLPAMGWNCPQQAGSFYINQQSKEKKKTTMACLQTNMIQPFIQVRFHFTGNSGLY